jgi:hypothetical protein
MRYWQRLKSSNWTFSLALTAFYLVSSAIVISHHEMWRDELQAWLLARDSASVMALLQIMHYEGHPPLWHLLLRLLTYVTHSPSIMQVLHLLIAGVTVFLIAHCSPFSKTQKTLLAFGYFFFYEYAILSRNYALGVLLLCVFCVLFPYRHSRFIPISLSLVLLGWTSVHALIVTIAIAVTLLAEYFLRRNQLQRDENSKARPIWIGFTCIAVGIVTAVLQLKPPPDSGFFPEWFLKFDWSRIKITLTTLSHAFVPIPRIELHFWSSDSYLLGYRLELILAVPLLLWIAIALFRKTFAFLVFLGSTMGLMLFFYVKHLGSLRHHGWLFMVFLAAVWIASYSDDMRLGEPWKHLWRLSEKSLSPVLTGILALHTVGGIIAASLDLQYEFSKARATAAFIRKHGLEDGPMVGDIDYSVSAVAGYLERPIYYPRGRRFGTFIIWNQARNRKPNVREILTDAMELASRNGRDVLIILNRPLNIAPAERRNVRDLAQFTGAIVDDEEFYLYKMGPP